MVLRLILDNKLLLRTNSQDRSFTQSNEYFRGSDKGLKVASYFYKTRVGVI